MDHYKVLGLARNASKAEIKEAFRKLAVKLHPDKHSASPKAERDRATVRFKQVSEAYQVLIDDRKRAEYNFQSSHRPHNNYNTYTRTYNYGYGYSGGNSYRRGGGSGAASGASSAFENFLRYVTTRAFLLNVSVAGACLGGIAVVNLGWDALWKMHNHEKSFEEAMKSVRKAKARTEKP
ncbi:chaperone protein dnaJ 72-like [Malus sylvestris]|uniref:chaperone protein dnaJ 72-like n=1 Tax=Malus sylvestris TaxID=3752 RepID=UPI0010AAFD12|nr:chaperone protein dnaJ 72-like [Malus domestica]XP_050122650.1 chaperone protein dnaJ 72-like [Malus sylvestris]